MSLLDPALAAEAVRPQLHHGPGTRSVRVLWVLEELGVGYDLHPVLFPARVRQPEFHGSTRSKRRRDRPTSAWP